MTNNIRVRFAPSPTGYLHIGNLHTALFNWLFARHHQGNFILRIEDTDFARSKKEYEQAIIEDLNWLGLSCDEGPSGQNNFGPYRQSEKLDIYNGYVRKLLDQGLAYPCFCQPDELEQKRKLALAKGRIPKYDGKCRKLAPEEKESLIKNNLKPAIRFKVNDEEDIEVDDLVKGKINFKSRNIGDFIILRSEVDAHGHDPIQVASYNFAVVVDDAQMQISHVIRGEDHLSNTPRQILLYRALGFPLPKFAHLSTILSVDKTPLSKRDEGISLRSLKEKGFLPQAIINYLALLGWHSADKEEIIPLDQIIKKFSLDQVSVSPGIYDLNKLCWINKHYLKELTPEKIYEQGKDFIDSRYLQKENLLAVLEILKDNISTFHDLNNFLEIFYNPNLSVDPEQYPDFLNEEGLNVIRLFKEKIEGLAKISSADYLAIVKSLLPVSPVKGKKFYMPLRLAVSGKGAGPELDRIIPLIPKEILMQRINSLIHKEGK